MEKLIKLSPKDSYSDSPDSGKRLYIARRADHKDSRAPEIMPHKDSKDRDIGIISAISNVVKERSKGDKKKVKMYIDFNKVIKKKIIGSGGSNAIIYSVMVDNWGCAMKEIKIKQGLSQETLKVYVYS